EHVHESSPSMSGVLIALAGAAALVGVVGIPGIGNFGTWVFNEHAHEGELVPIVAALSILAAGLGILGGYALYKRWREPDPVRKLGRAYTLLDHKYYLDDIYLNGIVF